MNALSCRDEGVDDAAGKPVVGRQAPAPGGRDCFDLWPECGSEGQARFVRAWRGWCQDVVVTEPETYPARLHRVGDYLQHWFAVGRMRQTDDDLNMPPPIPLLLPVTNGYFKWEYLGVWRVSSL